ncbi:ABC transporter substrate-binding protein [Nonomuraea sp. M3C6]|uniref:ABC transporter substrate-binding protein n=1 Tax=Nonomuraea marmarensis TaxID=3351344 RepID=A0ABW7AR13_9ACTN
MKPRMTRAGALAGGITLLVSLTACGGGGNTTATGAAASDAPGQQKDSYVIGVSNTLVGNGWREEMICSVKAEALASGKVSKVVVANRNGGPTEQIADLRQLISQGVNAIIVNPSDPAKLDPVIKQAKARGVIVVAVDQAVSAPEALVVANDQVAYGRLGGEWLAKAIGGKGNVVEMRGIAGAPADNDRHKGFTEALAKYPEVKVVKEVYTGWDYSKGGQQALDLLNSSDKVDGIWTSGIDYTVVKAFETLKKPYAPVVGADNNEFINQISSLHGKGFVGAAVTNPAAIGGVGTSIALQALSGAQVPRETFLAPEVWDVESAKDKLAANYFPDREATFSARVTVEPHTHYTPEQLFACKGPGE